MTTSQKDKDFIWHPYTQMRDAFPNIVIERGEGAYLFDEKGNRYIDVVSSWWVNLHGHAHPYLREAINKQFEKIEHVIFAGFTHVPAVNLSEKLLTHLPENQSKVFYSDDGSTAVEVALKMALQYWHNKGEAKTKLVALEGAYHGDTFGAMSTSGRSAFTLPFQSFLFDVEFADFPSNESRTLEQLENLFAKNDVAAFIFEPLVQGTAGMKMYSPELLKQMLSLCKKYNVISISDEVFTGFYRTGKFFAYDYQNEQPDIFCLSKGLTGGVMPLGVTTCTEKIYAAFLSDGSEKIKTFFHGHSYTANPLACAVAVASLELLEKEEIQDAIKRISEKHKLFSGKVKHLKTVKETRHLGTILAIELVGEAGYFSKMRNELYQFFISRGILIRPLGNVIYLVPPYCISDEDLDYVYHAIFEFLER
ncbi:MAG: Adenosylmethionine-8-amino-7-oxononanoate aminotransferase [Bacteroidia bacterium]|nr:Adenosylmethionine-8-amino-7-oxononanoate aminotransferase [Bacteroidia bacterium]